MNFAIPRKDAQEFLIYIWKIIDLPNIEYNELLYKISFELFLLSPEKAKQFIKDSINNNYITLSDDGLISLKKELEKKYINWQLAQRKKILTKINSKRDISIESELDINFSALLMAFLDKATLNRAAMVSDTSITIKEFNISKGIILAEIQGKKEDSYYIRIEFKNKILSHNCHDFKERRAPNKKFCKHLAKLFLILKEKDEDLTKSALHEIALNINEWDFSS